MAFKEQIENIKLQVDAQRISVLVWGPGEAAGQGYEKRQKIRARLQDCFHNAEVRFSEEMDLGEELPGIEDLALHEQELWHLAICDVCVVLDTSKGAGEEIAHFSTSTFAHKLRVLTNVKYKDSTSFPSSLRKYLNQVFYTDEEYDSCSLLDRVVTSVRQVALGKIARVTV